MFVSDAWDFPPVPSGLIISGSLPSPLGNSEVFISDPTPFIEPSWRTFPSTTPPLFSSPLMIPAASFNPLANPSTFLHHPSPTLSATFSLNFPPSTRLYSTMPTFAATGRDRFQSRFAAILSPVVGSLSMRLVTEAGIGVWPREGARKGQATKRAAYSGEAQEPRGGAAGWVW